MDFIRVAYKEDKTGIRQFYPALQAIESQDLVVRGGQFAAIWDDSVGLYNRRMSHLPSVIDRAFVSMVGEQMRPGDSIMKVKDFDNGIFNKMHSLIRGIGDMGPELDTKLIFADMTPTKADGATFKLPYALSDSDIPAWDAVCAKLYGPEERLKFEYAIGSIITGYSLSLHKLYVFYGPPGKGKSTIMDVIQLLFQGHFAAFDAYELGSNSSSFPLEPFMNNPLVAVDQDADLSKVETNVFLNKLVAHDKIQVNAKGKSLFEIHPRCCMFIGTNKPVKMTDSRSGLYRRVIDIHPTGDVFEETEYRRLVAAMTFELGGIAQHCVNVFNELGPQFFTTYKPTDMMSRTNDVYNFIQDNRLILMKGITVKDAATLYKEWCEETETRNVYKQFQLRDILKDYFEEWHEQIMIDGVRHRSWLQGLKEIDTFSWKTLTAPEPGKSWLDFSVQKSTFDELMADMPAQYSQDHPVYPLKQAWDDCTTTLKDLDTSREHFVKVPTQHIVVDIDGKDADGRASYEASLEIAAEFPPSYAEPSRSGDGIHIHYDFIGEVDRLAAEDGSGRYEVKTLLGGQSLRRRYTTSNGLPVSTISSGLPIKEEKPPVISATTMASEVGLRKQILKGLNKEVWGHTKPSMDFIKQVLEDAVKQDLVFDVTDMWDDILQFAMGSKNQQAVCINIAMNLPLKSEVDVADIPVENPTEKPIADFDVEVFPNLFAFAYLPDDSDVVVKMINPAPEEVLFVIENFRLVGFYNRLYDNHILWAATLGYSPEELYKLSQAIIVEGNRHKLFGAAYGLAYADLYDIFTTKQSLKKWEIDLGLPHMELDHPWDQPVPDDKVMEVMEYLENDVLSTRAARRHNKTDWRARELLCEITGLQMSNTANQHSAAAVFGDAKDTERELKYVHLKEFFPGYEFDRFKPGKDKSTYKGVVVGEGGYVYAEPGYYTNVALLDVASMHPTSIIEMNLFGKYTKNYENLLNQRLEVKAKIKAATTPEEKTDLIALSDALKLVINSVYGLTAASFPNKFRNPENIDNIVAKRGALFMVALKEFVEKAGFKVVHIKTDSIKIPNATPEIIADVGEFGSNYGYTFEHEATYEKFVLFNDAVYIARKDGEWSATGKQFQRPVVFKTLLSQTAIVREDYVEVKQVSKGHMYLVNQDESVRTFVGKFGAFVPVIDGRQLVRIDGEKVSAVTETKGYLWELEAIARANNMDVDIAFYQNLVDVAKAAIEKYVPYEELIA